MGKNYLKPKRNTTYHNNPYIKVLYGRTWETKETEIIKSHKIKARYRILMSKYNITQEEYNKMFDEQHGCCKICEAHQSTQSKALCVDHIHDDEKKIRGLLCSNCNTLLGLCYDDPRVLRKAIEYLGGECAQSPIGTGEV